MNSWPRVDFEKLVQEVRDAKCGQEDLSLWSGQCTVDDLPKFFHQWDLSEMPYRIWENISDITFNQEPPPQNVTLLERARLFGKGGDLDVWRDGNAFMWRFVGPEGVRPPTGDYNIRDYWTEHPEMRFYRFEETSLFWGEWDGEKWGDDQVGAAILNYPIIGNRVQVCYTTYSYAGRIAFIWLKVIEDKEGE